MIALDTNALVRMLIEDDKKQARAVEDLVLFAEKNSYQLIILFDKKLQKFFPDYVISNVSDFIP